MSRYRLGVIPGDGIGPEVTHAALVVLDAAERRFGFATERTTIAGLEAQDTRRSGGTMKVAESVANALRRWGDP